MKPLKLSLQAFGSYVTRQEIDFERIARAPLFLIHGPTGAGKTTILDGICYALYGEASVSYRLGKHPVSYTHLTLPTMS